MKKVLLGMLISLGLVSGVQAADVAQLTAVCAGCHGPDGNSMVPTFPKLAGQGERYLLKQLNDIKSGARAIPEMTGLLDKMSADDLAAISAHYAGKKMQGGQADPALVELGQKIYRAGNEKSGVSACTACHGPAGKGVDSAAFPALAGQHAAYVESSLVKFSKGQRANDPNAMMRTVAAAMKESEMKAVSAYIQGLYE
ncbi:cytochrome c [Marinobacterium sp. LSUCC0821]|jgi:cytochrome c553|uniref:c-type cytochrome n=1 Tax=Marinobacterium sp. LSUCC0821 TaxID=2668067 RepID=UPI001451E21F|nr:c-type cytochrome [Marinobacterium sp. LSUCC0821]QJD71786.1 cytochrome c4 [Marinobacterium sp. LSUCC0821]